MRVHDHDTEEEGWVYLVDMLGRQRWRGSRAGASSPSPPSSSSLLLLGLGRRASRPPCPPPRELVGPGQGTSRSRWGPGLGDGSVVLLLLATGPPPPRASGRRPACAGGGDAGGTVVAAAAAGRMRVGGLRADGCARPAWSSDGGGYAGGPAWQRGRATAWSEKRE